MDVFSRRATDQAGNGLSATVTVYLDDQITLASDLYTAEGDPLTNPFSTDAQGLAEFAAVTGKYWVAIDYQSQRKWVYAQLIDLADIVSSKIPHDGASAVELGAEVGVALDTLGQIYHYLVGTPDQILITPSIDGLTLTFGTPQPIGINSDVQFRDVTMRHVRGIGVPTVTLDVGAGSGATYQLSGHDRWFQLEVTTGTAPVIGGRIANIAFAEPFTAAPMVAMIPTNARSWAVQSGLNAACSVGLISANSFNFNAGSGVALGVSQTYGWNFMTSEK